MPEDRKSRGQYIDKDNVAFWFPVSKNDDATLKRIVDHLKQKEGKYTPPFQTISRAIQEFAKALGV